MSKQGLTAFQRRQIADLEAHGWTFVRVKNLHDDLNDFASVDMRNPEGELTLVACATSKRVEDYYLGETR